MQLRWMSENKIDTAELLHQNQNNYFPCMFNNAWTVIFMMIYCDFPKIKKIYILWFFCSIISAHALQRYAQLNQIKKSTITCSTHSALTWEMQRIYETSGTQTSSSVDTHTHTQGHSGHLCVQQCWLFGLETAIAASNNAPQQTTVICIWWFIFYFYLLIHLFVVLADNKLEQWTTACLVYLWIVTRALNNNNNNKNKITNFPAMCDCVEFISKKQWVVFNESVLIEIV